MAALPGVASTPPQPRNRTSSSVATHPSHSQSLRHGTGPGNSRTSVSNGSSHSRNRTSTIKLPTAPSSIASSALVNQRALLTGKYLITIGEGAVIHPYARINSSAGEVVIGKGCIIEERASVGCSNDHTIKPRIGNTDPSSNPVGADENATSTRARVILGYGVTVGPGAIIESATIGDMTIVDGGAIVGSGSVLGKFCKIGPSLTVSPGSNIKDFTILYGGGIPPGVPLAALLPRPVKQSPLPSRSGAIQFSLPPSTASYHTPHQSIDLMNSPLQTPVQTPTRNLEHPGARTNNNNRQGRAQYSTPPPQRRIDTTTRDNEVVRLQRRSGHERHLGVLRKLLMVPGNPPSGPSSSSTSSSTSATGAPISASTASISSRAAAPKSPTTASASIPKPSSPSATSNLSRS